VIRYALVCHRHHAFETWFANAAAYDKQAKRGLVTCPTCGSAKVEKAIMAPALARSGRSRHREPAPAAGEQPGSAPAAGDASAAAAAPEEKAPVAIVSEQERELRRKLKELREHLLKNADYVGPRFPEEARRMHYGEAEHRSIYGEASPEEARALQEEGIEFHPLPRLPDECN
jgi:hypothetical protein